MQPLRQKSKAIWNYLSKYVGSKSIGQQNQNSLSERFIRPNLLKWFGSNCIEIWLRQIWNSSEYNLST